MSWLKRLLILPGDDIRPGDIVKVAGVGDVVVVDASPRGRKSGAFVGVLVGSDPVSFNRDEIVR